mgnify:CR=1 FL=1
MSIPTSRGEASDLIDRHFFEARALGYTWPGMDTPHGGYEWRSEKHMRGESQYA